MLRHIPEIVLQNSLPDPILRALYSCYNSECHSWGSDIIPERFAFRSDRIASRRYLLPNPLESGHFSRWQGLEIHLLLILYLQQLILVQTGICRGIALGKPLCPFDFQRVFIALNKVETLDGVIK